MKQFAFPFSVLCANDTEQDKCVKILEELGYQVSDVEYSDYLICTNRRGKNNTATSYQYHKGIGIHHEHNRHHIDHFNHDLVRDIAAACKNDTWQVGEPCYCHDVRRIDCYVKNSGYKRPTLAEICEHHGYEIKGKDIVKIEPKCNDLQTIEELQDRIKELEAENKKITERHETFTRNIDKVISNLESENATLKERLSKTVYELPNTTDSVLDQLSVNVVSFKLCDNNHGLMVREQGSTSGMGAILSKCEFREMIAELTKLCDKMKM